MSNDFITNKNETWSYNGRKVDTVSDLLEVWCMCRTDEDSMREVLVKNCKLETIDGLLDDCDDNLEQPRSKCILTDPMLLADLKDTVDCNPEDVLDYWKLSAREVAIKIFDIPSYRIKNDHRIVIEGRGVLVWGYNASYLIRN